MPSIVPLLLPAGTFLLRFLPRALACAIARAVGDACWLLMPGRRRVIQENLEYIASDRCPRDRQRLARATFRNFARVWVDFLRLPLLRRAEIATMVQFQARIHLEEAMVRGSGVVLVTPHLGGVELLGVYLAAAGYPITGVAEDVDPATYETWRRYRTSTGMKLLSRRRGAVAAFRALRRGEVVGLVADRLIGGPGLAVGFCGGVRQVPVGPAVFALRANAPVVVACLVRRARGSPPYSLIIEPVWVPSRDPVELTRVISTALADLVKRYPDQWFVFQPGWIDMHETPQPNGASGALSPQTEERLACRVP